MRNYLKLLARLIIFSLSCVASHHAYGQCSQPKQDAKPATVLAITAAQESIAAGSPVWVELTVTNKSKHEISLWREVSGRDFQVEVKDHKGKFAKDTKYGYSRNGRADPARLTPEDLSGSGACVTLGPGKSLSYKLDISKLYDLTQPGEYTIQAERSDSESTATVKSNKIVIKLTD